MGYLLDTDTVSELMRARPRAGLLAKLAMVDPEDQFTSSVTIGELVYGAYRTDRPEHFLAAIDERVLPNVGVLVFDEPAARVYGRIRAHLERAGQRLAEPDLRVASIALVSSHTVVTGNVRHFSRVPDLRVENWLTE